MARTFASTLGRRKISIPALTPAATRTCSHHIPGAMAAVPAAARAPTASMISTRSSETTSATASNRARLSHNAHPWSPSQSVRFTVRLLIPWCQASGPRAALNRSARLRRPAPVPARELDLEVERLLQQLRGQRRPDRAGGDDPTPLEQQHVRDADGDLLDV